eukprot:GFYU01001125.1.p1 GENE.GFYU01001125.1~~GFYU01001125.1.p1  ORF type:complete len:600 (-),score=141.79 GFYU01001125.1:1482-3281(-)
MSGDMSADVAPASGSRASAQVAASALGGFKYLVSLQLVSRVFTFVLNLSVARHVSASVYGVANIQLHLLLAGMQFLREGLRRCILRLDFQSTTGDDDDKAKKARDSTVFRDAIDVSWWCVVITTVFALAACVSVTSSLQHEGGEGASEELTTSAYLHTVWLYGAAAVAEMLSEPLYVVAQTNMLFRPRVLIESNSTLLKCVVTFVAVVSFEWGIVSFAYGQLVFGVMQTVGYVCYFAYTMWWDTSASPILSPVLRDWRAYVPSPSNMTELIRRAVARPSDAQAPTAVTATLMSSWVSTSGEAFTKFVLTEGEKMVLISVSTSHIQGVYGVVNNLGSLVARFLFQPLEESALTVFSKLLGNVHRRSGGSDGDAEREDSVRVSMLMLTILLQTVVIIGLIFVSFGPNYSFLLLDILYGARWTATDAPQVLMMYCFYVFVIAINGITEAFCHAVSTEQETRRYSVILVVLTAVYLIATYVLCRAYGAAGLVVGNCFNMIMRITYNAIFIRDYYNREDTRDTSQSPFQWSACMPSWKVMFAFAATFVVTAVSNTTLCCSHGWQPRIVHIGLGAACLLVDAAAIWKFEKKYIQNVRSFQKLKNE